MVSVPARRGQVVYATGRGLSQRRACTLVQVGRSALQYRSRKAVKNAAVIARMQELSAQYPRFGYRRVRIFLGRDGFAMSPGRAHRLWRVAKLQVPRKRPRKRIASSRPRPQTPVGPNQVWAFDFVFDACADGRQLKCLTVADEFTKEGLAIEVDGRIRVNGTLNLTRACRYRHFESDPSASSLFPRSREQCGQMLSSLSFALLGRAMMPARRLSLSR